MILSAGADLTRCAWGYNIWASYGYAQPMIGAAAASNVPLSELLLEFGADVNSRHILSGFTPFLAACSHHARRHASSEARLAMLQWLISKEAEPFATNHLGQTAFDVAVDSMGVTPPDSALFYFLMEMKIPVHDMWLYRVKREYEITEEPELKVILDYAAGPGKPIRMRKTKSPAC